MCIKWWQNLHIYLNHRALKGWGVKSADNKKPDGKKMYVKGAAPDCLQPEWMPSSHERKIYKCPALGTCERKGIWKEDNNSELGITCLQPTQSGSRGNRLPSSRLHKHFSPGLGIGNLVSLRSRRLKLLVKTACNVFLTPRQKTPDFSRSETEIPCWDATNSLMNFSLM